jgi:uncharacterized membrane protein YebE (DUF533 family)
MFDARSILDILLGGGPQPRQGRPADPTVFRDMLDQLGSQDGPPTAGRQPGPGPGPQPAPDGHWTEQRYPQGPLGPPPAPTGGTSFEDLLRNILQQIQQQGPAGGRQATPGGQPAPSGPAAPEIGRELQDLLRQILQGGGGGGQRANVSRVVGEGGQDTGKGNELVDALKQVLGQATAGAREGAARIDEATGLSDRAREVLGQATGQTPEEIIAKVRGLIANNQLAAGAALGGLGALVLGTGAGRSLAATALKMGGLALIGGLAYKAYQNYQQGRPPLAPDQQAQAKPQSLLPAPEGSGFEVGAMSQDAALRCIRATIAAAAADGRIDATEQQKIVSGLRQAGIDDAARQFLAAEIGNPASVAELASGVASPEEAVQVYAAARIAVDPDTGEEHAFLSSLAEALGIDDALAAQVDAAARGGAA